MSKSFHYSALLLLFTGCILFGDTPGVARLPLNLYTLLSSDDKVSEQIDSTLQRYAESLNLWSSSFNREPASADESMYSTPRISLRCDFQGGNTSQTEDCRFAHFLRLRNLAPSFRICGEVPNGRQKDLH